MYCRVESAHRDLEPVLSCMDASGKVGASRSPLGRMLFSSQRRKDFTCSVAARCPLSQAVGLARRMPPAAALSMAFCAGRPWQRRP